MQMRVQIALCASKVREGLDERNQRVLQKHSQSSLAFFESKFGRTSPTSFGKVANGKRIGKFRPLYNTEVS